MSRYPRIPRPSRRQLTPYRHRPPAGRLRYLRAGRWRLDERMVTTAPPIGAGPKPRARRAIDQLRSTVELATDPHRALPNLYRRFGPVCTLGVGSTRNVFLLGA